MTNENRITITFTLEGKEFEADIKLDNKQFNEGFDLIVDQVKNNIYGQIVQYYKAIGKDIKPIKNKSKK